MNFKNIISQEFQDYISYIVEEKLKELSKPKVELIEEDKITLITRDEASKLLNVSLVTLNSWSKKGILTSYKIGTRVRYKENEVINSLRRKGGDNV